MYQKKKININQLKSIPGLVSNNIDALLGELQNNAQSTVINLNTDSQASNNASSNIATSNGTTSITDTFTVMVYNPDAEHANLIMEFINTNFANANVTLANATANSYDKSGTQSP